MFSEVTELTISPKVADVRVATTGEARFMATHLFDWRIQPIQTAGPLMDTSVVVHFRQALLPPTAYLRPTTHVLDISKMIPSPGVLLDLVVPLGQQIRGGMNGDSRLVFVTADPGVSETVRLLAKEHQLPIFLSASTSPEDIGQARPTGRITEAESQTLEVLRQRGGYARAAEIAKDLGLEPSAAHNRLDALTQKGYLFRFRRPRRLGDLYVDPRTPPEKIPSSEEAPLPMGTALKVAGISSDPYDRSPLRLEGASADRVSEILRRRGKAE